MSTKVYILLDRITMVPWRPGL